MGGGNVLLSINDVCISRYISYCNIMQFILSLVQQAAVV